MRWSPQWQNYKFRAPQGRTGQHSLTRVHRQYVLLFTLSMTAASLIFWLPAIYVTHQNSSVLTSLYLDQNPSLILGLSQDLLWLQVSFIIGILTLSFSSYQIAKRVMNRLSGPLLKIEEKLNAMNEGKRVEIDSDRNQDKIYDKFLDLVERTQEEREDLLEILNSVQISVSDKNNYLLIDVLKRRLQSNFRPPMASESVDHPSQVPSKRMVS